MDFFKFRWLGEREQGDASSQRSRVPPAESAELMRRRARHRLIGAAVLVLAGVLGFPLLFDTQPRPVPVDIPIEIPDRAKVAPLVVPSNATGEASPAKAGGSPFPLPFPPAVSLGKPAEPVRPGTGLVDGEELVATPPRRVPPAPAARPEAPPEPKPVPRPEAKPAQPQHKPEPRTEAKAEPKPHPVPVKPEPKPESRPAAASKAEHKPVVVNKPEPKETKVEPKPVERKPALDEAARAKALLEGSAAKAPEPPARAEGERALVQVGAFADPDKVREVRSKLERAGLKTYTQVVETKDGKRTRVRVGPFASRAEADKAAARVRALDLSASVVTQ